MFNLNDNLTNLIGELFCNFFMVTIIFICVALISVLINSEVFFVIGLVLDIAAVVLKTYIDVNEFLSNRD